METEPRRVLTEVEMLKIDLNAEANRRRKLELEAFDLHKKLFYSFL